MPKRRSSRIALSRKAKAPKFTPRKSAGRFFRPRGKATDMHPVLFYDRTVARGLSFPQAETFPAGQIVKLHYNHVNSLTSTGVSGTFMPEYVYRLNSAYDPNLTGTGGQPYFFDTLFGANGTSAPYRQYRVLSTKIDIQWYNDNTSSGAAMMVGASVGLELYTTAGTVAASQLMMQRPNTRIVPGPVMSNGQGVTGMTIYVSHKKLLGVKDMKDADDQIADYNSSPAGASPLLGLFVFPIDTGSALTVEVWYRVHITYTVECRTLNTVTES